jgi:hypothetical protein
MVEDIEYLRHAMDLVTYEEYGFGYIMARANNFLNHRRVVGFIVLKPDSGKRCTMDRVVRVRYRVGGRKDKYTRSMLCGNKAVIAVLFEYYDKKFREYMCYECFVKFLTNTVKYVEKKVRHVLDKFSILGLNSVTEVPDWFW